MKKTLRYFRRIYKMTRMKQNSYLVNSLIQTFTRMAYLLSSLGVIYFAYHLLPSGATIKGATFLDTVSVFLIFQICFYCLGIFFYNYPEFIKQIYNGGIDTKLLQPISSYWGILFQEIYPTSVRDTLYGLILLIGITVYSNSLSILEWIALFGILASSCIILSSLNFLFTSSALFFEGFVKSPNWFKDQASQVCRYPKEIYPFLLQWIFFPLFFVGTPLFALLQHRFTMSDAMLQLFMTLTTLLLSIFIWNKGLRRYESAN